MDFIEKLFGISPDAGSGAAELNALLVPILILALLVTLRYLRRT